jgi:hypothetical protein
MTMIAESGSAQAQLHERGHGVQRHGDRQHELARRERPRPDRGPEGISDRQRPERERVLAHGPREQHGDALAAAAVHEKDERDHERNGGDPLQEQIRAHADEPADAEHGVPERHRRDEDH